MNNMDINEINEITGRLNKDVNRLMKLQNEALSKLPPDQYKHVQEAHKDSNTILRSMRNGDLNTLQEMIKKYADTNNKR